MTPITFNSWVTTMAGLLSVQPETVLYPDNTELTNAMIAYAEGRIYRELDFLHTQKEATTADMTPGTRTIAVPGELIIVNSASIITPASTAPDAGRRKTLQRVSIEFLNFTWPDATARDVPSHYAMLDDVTIAVAPTPDAGYRLSCMGVFRPTPLSFTNQSTFLTTFVPDLFVAASAIFGFGGVISNFGGQSDDPQSAQSWEQTYQNLRAGVDMENLRSKAWSAGWQPWSPSPGAKESRT